MGCFRDIIERESVLSSYMLEHIAYSVQEKLAGARSNVFEGMRCVEVMTVSRVLTWSELAVADVLMYITDNLPRICTYIKAWRSQAIDNLTGTIANPAAYALRDIVKYLTDVADIMSSSKLSLLQKQYDRHFTDISVRVEAILGRIEQN